MHTIEAGGRKTKGLTRRYSLGACELKVSRSKLVGVCLMEAVWLALLFAFLAFFIPGLDLTGAQAAAGM